MTDLLVIGDVSIDEYMVIENPHMIGDQICFLHGSKIPVKEFHETLAGNAAHVGVGAQRLGLQTSIYTELGDDARAGRFIDKFKKEGINTKHCNKNKGTSTNVHAIIVYEGERTIFSYHEPRTYRLDFSKLENPQWVYYTSLARGFEKLQEELVSYLKNNSDIVVAFNPGTRQLKAGVSKLTSILQITHVLFVNKREAYKLLETDPKGDLPLREVHKKLHELGPKITVITDGKRGSSAFDEEEFIELQALKPDGPVIDKTGSGDSYAVAFLAALHYKKTLRESMNWGNKNAVSIIKSVGCLDGLLTKEQIG